ncbi:MAG: hypothetical protein ABJA10_02750 [Aestuariivirga sp.]
MKLAINVSPEIAAAIMTASEIRGVTASTIIREKLALALGVQDNFKPRMKWKPDPLLMPDSIPPRANI